MELTNWRQLSDRGRELVLCLDFPGGRLAAGFPELAAGVSTDACFLHIGQTGAGPLADGVERWVADVRATGRPVRAVLGYCAGAAIATCVADAISETGPPPVVLLFDAMATTAGSLADQCNAALESSSAHLTEDELAGARAIGEKLVETYSDDLPSVAAGLTEEYDRLMGEVARRLSLNDFYRRELTKGFVAYLDYLLLAGEGRFDISTGTPVFLSSTGHELPVEGVRNVTLDVGHADLLRDAGTHRLVDNLLSGAQPW